MPRSGKKLSKAQASVKKEEMESKTEGHWVHVEDPEQDLWEIVEGTDSSPKDRKDTVDSPDDDDIIDILTDNLASGVLPSSSHVGLPEGAADMEKSSDFDFVDIKTTEDLDVEEAETSFMTPEEPKTDEGTSDIIAQATQSSIFVKDDSPESQESTDSAEVIPTHEEAAEIGELPEKVSKVSKTKRSKGKKNKGKQLQVESSDSPVEPVKNSSVVEKSEESMLAQSEAFADTEISGADNSSLTSATPANDRKPAEDSNSNNDSGNSSNSKSKKRKGKKSKKAVGNVDEDVDDVNKIVEEEERESSPEQASTDNKFVTYSKHKGARDFSTLSILLAKDETLESLEGQSQEDSSVISNTIPETVETLVSEEAEERESSATPSVDRESSVDDVQEDVADEGNSVHGSNGSPRLSKSAKRRKKQKAKMAKAIEKFSNPALLMEKYEKTFGEVYEGPSTEESEIPVPVTDLSLTCPVCLEIYHHPHRVQPCGHIFCDPCLRKLVNKSTLEVDCPMCRKPITSCVPDEELSARVSSMYPNVVIARNRAERKSKSKKTPLPRVEQKPLSQELISQLVTASNRTRNSGHRTQLPFSRGVIQKLQLVIICVISYLFTSTTIRAISALIINTNEDSTSTIFVLIVFCAYFYFIDKGVKKLLAFYEG